MGKLIKLQKPKFIDEIEEINDIYQEITIADKIQNKSLNNELLEDKDDYGVTIDSCVFRNVVFSNCSLRNIDLIDTIFENCDLSNIDFSGGSIHRVEFINCKLLGAKLDDTSIKNVLFKDCLGKYSNFSFAKLNSVNFTNCNMEEITFQEVKLSKVAFDNSNFINGYFNKTSLAKIDLTNCDITGINLEISDISEATVNTMQALELTRLLNITIK